MDQFDFKQQDRFLNILFMLPLASIYLLFHLFAQLGKSTHLSVSKL